MDGGNRTGGTNSLDYVRDADYSTKTLHEFLDQVMDLMEAVILHHEHDANQVSDTARQAFTGHRRVLKTETKNDGTVGDIDRILLTYLKSSFNKRNGQRSKLHQDIENSAEALEPFGLSGDELRLKLTGWWRALRNFLHTGHWTDLDACWRWANAIFKSMIAAIPGMEPVTELKDALHNLYLDA